MSRVSNRFSVSLTALGSIALALASIGTAGCGGKGERLTPNVVSTEDAGVKVNACNLTATLDIANFGCTPGLTASGINARCLDFEGYPAGTGARPTGFFIYADQIETDASGLPDASVPKPAFLDYADYTRLVAGSDDTPCGVNTLAYHLVAVNQLVWGVQFGAKFTGQSDGPLPPVNISDWDGVGFWIKKGNNHPELEPTGTSLFVSLSDPNTVSNLSKLDSDPPCNDASNIDAKKCDAYGAGVSFDTHWRYVMLQFDDLKQRGYGVHQDTLDRTKIERIKFATDVGDAANGNWNIWIDDVMLYKYK